jgi:hypothetical protein
VECLKCENCKTKTKNRFKKKEKRKKKRIDEFDTFEMMADEFPQFDASHFQDKAMDVTNTSQVRKRETETRKRRNNFQ